MKNAAQLQDYYDRLARHDWFAHMSDAPGVFAAACRREEALQKEAEGDEQALALWDAFRDAYGPMALDKSKLPARPVVV